MTGRGDSHATGAPGNGPALAVSGSNPTGEAAFSACLRLGNDFHSAATPTGQRGDLARLVADLLATHDVAPDQLVELRTDFGPGSYTGLRIALTFVRFLQHFGEVRVLACDTLALVAHAAAAPAAAPPTGDGRLRPVLDARRGRWHCGAFATTGNGGALRQLEPSAALVTDDVLASARADDTFIVPPGFDTAMRERLAERATVITTQPETAFASALFTRELAEVLAPCAPTELEPRYLMGTYAD